MTYSYEKAIALIQPFLNDEKNLTTFANTHGLNYRTLLYIKNGHTKLKYIKAVTEILEIYGFTVHSVEKVIVFNITREENQ